MKKIILAAALMLGLSTTAFAQQYYVEGFGGATFAPDLEYGCCEFEMDNGFNVGGSFGTNVNGFDVEGEIFYSRSDYADYDTNINGLALMVNVLYGFPIANTVEGYVGGGIGGVKVEYDGENDFPSFTGDDWVFGWQLIGGVMYPLANNVSLFGEYRYQQASDADIQGVSNVEYRGHHLSIGVRAAF